MANLAKEKILPNFFFFPATVAEHVFY